MPQTPAGPVPPSTIPIENQHDVHSPDNYIRIYLEMLQAHRCQLLRCLLSNNQS